MERPLPSRGGVLFLSRQSGVGSWEVTLVKVYGSYLLRNSALGSQVFQSLSLLAERNL